MGMNERKRELIFRIQNKVPAPLAVYLEPWADKFTLSAGQAVEFRVKGPVNGDPSELIEIHVETGMVTVYDNWPESEMTGRIIDATH